MLQLEGVVEGVYQRKTKKGESFSIVQFEYRLPTGRKMLIDVCCFRGRNYKVGEKVTIPVFVNAYVSNGRAGYSLVVSDGGAVVEQRAKL